MNTLTEIKYTPNTFSQHSTFNEKRHEKLLTPDFHSQNLITKKKNAIQYLKNQIFIVTPSEEDGHYHMVDPIALVIFTEFGPHVFADLKIKCLIIDLNTEEVARHIEVTFIKSRAMDTVLRKMEITLNSALCFLRDMKPANDNEPQDEPEVVPEKMAHLDKYAQKVRSEK